MLEVDIENGLVRLEDHAVAHLEILVQVEPRAVRARFVVEAVREDPGLRLGVELNASLTLREELVIDLDVAVWRPSNDDRLPCIFLLIVIDLSRGRPSKDLELELDGGVV